MNWKSLALISTSLAALSFSATAALAVPAPPVMGTIELGATQWFEDWSYGGSDTGNTNWVSLTGAGRVNIPYSSRINVQLDFFGDASLDGGFHNYSSDGTNVGNTGGAVHFNYREPSQGLIGFFGAIGRVQDYSWSAPAFMGGFEAQYFCDNWTFGAQAGYMDADGDYEFLWNGGFVRGFATYYASPRFKLTGGLGYIAGDSGVSFPGGTDTDSATAWNWTAEGRYWFGRSVPIAGFIRYEGRQQETHYSKETPQLTTNQVYIGFSWMFGGEDFKQTDRNGASTDIMSFDNFRLISD